MIWLSINKELETVYHKYIVRTRIIHIRRSLRQYDLELVPILFGFVPLSSDLRPNPIHVTHLGTRSDSTSLKHAPREALSAQHTISQVAAAGGVG